MKQKTNNPLSEIFREGVLLYAAASSMVSMKIP